MNPSQHRPYTAKLRWRDADALYVRIWHQDGPYEGTGVEIATANQLAHLLNDAHAKGRESAAQWLPMDSAPKDGTRILVKDDDGTVCVVAWLDGKTTRRGRAAMEWAIPESWQDEQGGYSSVELPTGWMPLPS